MATALPIQDVQARYTIVGYEEIPVENIRPHPLNPRPSFHLKDNDPELVSMGDSIRTTGQSQPALVFELKGHHEYPDEPGQYMLLQGERRWRSCRIADVKSLRCFIAVTPGPDEEMELLGAEEAFKVDWGMFFKLKYARDLAAKLNLPLVHAGVVAKTGLSLDSLRLGEKVFSLEPAIQYLVVEYEEAIYRQSMGTRRKVTRLAKGAGVNTGDFTVQKAAQIYDIFELLRKVLPTVVKEYDDLELQRRLAAKVSHGASLKDLETVSMQLRDMGNRIQPGVTTEISRMLEEEGRKLTTLVKTSGAAESVRLSKTVVQIAKLDNVALKLAENQNQLGSNPQTLMDAQRKLLSAMRSFERLERKIERRIDALNSEASAT